MTINKKVFFIIGLTLALLTLTIIVNTAFNFKNYGYKKANESAKLTAKAVRDGLTTMMVTGNIDKRSYFLDNIAKQGEITNIKVIRSTSLSSQYGNGEKQETAYDNIERKVLSSGKDYSEIIERDGTSFLRVTIPYIATLNSTPDCLTCHNANRGDVLGAISMEVNLSDVIDEGRLIVLKITILSLIFMAVSLIIAGYYIRPYIKLFNDLEDGITQAYHGDFSYHIKTNLGSEAGIVAEKLNNLSEIFLFKKTIERDRDKDAVYSRLVHILKNTFKLSKFWLLEIDAEKKEKTSIHCDANGCNDKLKRFLSSDECRALRTNDEVISTDFPNLCGRCSIIHENHICIPFTLGNKKVLILNVEFETADEVREFDEYIPIIKNYLETAKPVLESRILMEVLEESSLKDPMTGLYNRRFLENFIEINLREDSKYAVLMIDIDFFKMVNDSFGHDVGDRAIKTLSRTLSKNIKGSDIAIRYGGEEFIVMLFDINQDVAIKIAEKIRVDFADQKIDANSQIIQKTVSIGVAFYPELGHNHWQTIKFADEALYKAKEGGRNKIVVFEESMHGTNNEY